MSNSKRRINANDLWAVKRVGTPSLSPDGRRAVVDLTTYDVDENVGRTNLWVLSTAGGESPRQLTTHTGKDRSPLWSPDSSLVCFVSQREGDSRSQVYVIDVDGGEARRVSNVPTGVSAPKWFPDGKRIAFVSWVWADIEGDEAQAARLAERESSKVKAFAVETTTVRFWDHWLADGRVPHLFVVDVATGEHRDLFSGTELSLLWYDNSADLSPSIFDIAPDGSEIAFEFDATKDPGRDSKGDLATMQVDGGVWANITADCPGECGSPRYSPDGNWIAYARQEVRHHYADRRRVAVYERQEGHHRVLTEGWDRSVDSLTWTPDSARILCLAEEHARQPIWTVPLADGEPTQFVSGGSYLGFAVGQDGNTLVYVRSTIDEPPAVFAADADGSNVRRIESFNDALVAEWDLGKVEEIVYDGWNGEPVQMWVVYPPDFDPSKKWPLMHDIHGGPHAASTDVFHFRWNMHAFAAAGYVVAAVNYHGSTGWGEEFTKSNMARLGEKEFADIEAATDRLLATGAIDSDRLTAAGGSYGGYMVAWMNGHTDRYKAFVCHAGVYNWVSQMACDVAIGRDIQMGGYPWDNPELVLAQSAHAFIKGAKTPTLVVHGELDYRVPVTQGLEYYATLRMLDVPSRLVYFPDENHWVLKPQNSLLWYREFFGWLDRYAPGGPR